MSPVSNLPEGSWILITGVNGLIGTHVARQFLQRNYKVRGSVRNLQKSKWLIDDLFATEAANGSFELVVVEDMARPNAYHEAIRGVAGIIHVATIISLDPNPTNVIPQTIAGVVNIVEDAAAEPSVKEFVYTSSIVAAALPMPDTPFHVNANNWNDTAVSAAWAPPPYNPDRALITYMASKVEAEKALWKFVEERKPQFTVNAVLPFTVFGPLLHEKQNPSTVNWVLSLFNGDASQVSMMNACKLPFHTSTKPLLIPDMRSGLRSRRGRRYFAHRRCSRPVGQERSPARLVRSI